MRDPAELLSKYFDDSLAEGELAELRELLAAEPKRLREFVRDSVIHSRLRDILLQDDMRGLVFGGAFGDEVDPKRIESLLDQEEAASARRARAAAEQLRREATSDGWNEELLDRKSLRIEEPRTPRALVYASFAVVATLLVMVGRLIGPAPELKALPSVAAPRVAELPVIAQVAKTFDAQWGRADQSLAAGAKLHAGPLMLEQGVAEVKFAAGAKIVVEGPAELELLTADRAKLISGRVVAQVPQQALGFTLHAKRAAFVDLGTEFGVEIDASGLASVHVLDGEVALVSESKATTPSRTLQRGAAGEVRLDGSIRDIPYDEALFLRHVPASAYELAVLKSRPLAYWRLGQSENNATMTSEGRLGLAALLTPGVTLADNPAPEGNGPARAALFVEEHDGIEVAADAALGLVSNRTCEAWVLPGEAPSGPQRIFSTFDRPRSGLAIGVVDGRWYKLPEDDLKFQLTVYGVYDCVSATAIPVGQWIHVAATIDAAGTPTLFVNGAQVDGRFRPIGAAAELAASEGNPAPWSFESPTPIGVTTAGEARIGRNPLGADGQISPERWQGRISNVAIYDRALTAEEIRQHFDATRNTMTDTDIDGQWR